MQHRVLLMSTTWCLIDSAHQAAAGLAAETVLLTNGRNGEKERKREMII
jgi:hypothetical protein